MKLFCQFFILLALYFCLPAAYGLNRYNLRTSFDYYPYQNFRAAPFTVIETDSSFSIPNRTFRFQFRTPIGFSFEIDRLFFKRIYLLVGYSFTHANERPDIETSNDISRILELDNFKRHEVYTGIKYFFPCYLVHLLPYVGLNLGIAITPAIRTREDIVNGIMVDFGSGRTRATYYKTSIGPMVEFNLGATYQIFKQLNFFVEAGFKITNQLRGSGLVDPVRVPIAPEVRAVRLGNTGITFAVPLKIGLLLATN